ncbi:cupin domain-containing protein [Burkholderia pyrrocinia]|uniref:cupin domain-containing protein n=1 Tax=Burkholderia pyrrocinia TaxID=60550 RepID=UPI0030D486A3
MMVRDLDELIAPLPVEAFLGEYWGARPFVLHRHVEAAYRGLPCTPDFEHLAYALTNPRDGWVSVVRTNARPAGEDMLTEEGLLNLTSLYAAYDAGYSVLLNQVQRRHRATGDLCRTLERELTAHGIGLSRHIGANAYLSPPDSQGFRIHYDPHDVLILQLEGRKDWRLYGYSRQRWPRRAPERPTEPDDAGTPQQAFTLDPGDFLYVPRGMLHDASTTDSHSLHLTLSVETLTWAHLLEELVTSCDQLGQDLPRGVLESTARTDELIARIDTMLRHLNDRVAVDEASATLAGRLLANLDPLAGGGFAAVDVARTVDASTWLEHRKGNFGRVECDGDQVVLHLPGTTMRAGRSMETAFRYVLDNERVRARDLPIRAGIREKIAFMAELVKKGFLVPQTETMP